MAPTPRSPMAGRSHMGARVRSTASVANMMLHMKIMATAAQTMPSIRNAGSSKNETIE